MGRLLALDVGSRRIGVALSDELGLLATPHGAIQRRSLRRDLAAIVDLVRDQSVERIVVGLPLGLQGQVTQQTQATHAFADRLREVSPVPIELWDESNTSWEARQIVGSSPETRRSGRIDAMAAALILQGYLDQRAAVASEAAGAASLREARS